MVMRERARIQKYREYSGKLVGQGAELEEGGAERRARQPVSRRNSSQVRATKGQ